MSPDPGPFDGHDEGGEVRPEADGARPERDAHHDEEGRTPAEAGYEAGDGEDVADDSPAARRRWLLRVALILAAMILIPGVVYRLTAPEPVRVTVAPPARAAQGWPGLMDALEVRLEEEAVLTVVSWDREGPEGADLVLELELPEREDPGADVTVRLFRPAGAGPVWEGRVPVSADEELAARLARAVARAVTGRV